MHIEGPAGQNALASQPEASGFEEKGWIRLRGAFDPAGMAEALWQALSEHGVRADDTATWRQHSARVVADKSLTKLGKSGAFAGVAGDEVAATLGLLLGDGWTEQSGGWGRPLVTFPTDGSWDIPTGGWHLDMPPAHPLPAVRMFAYLSDVREQGGGTVVIEGSHRLASAYPGMHSRAIRKLLAAEHPWFREVSQSTSPERLSRLMREGAEVNGARVRVVELTGTPGDVVLWHPSLFHAAAPNTSSAPRFMLTHTALRRAL